MTLSCPLVAIVGRPNVGKSTLFNRIVGEQVAIVEDQPGVTRDRKEVEAEWLGVPFLLVDTGGWLPGGSDLDDKVSRQVEAAVRDADVVLFVVDATVGITDDDAAVADWLRRVEPAGAASSPTRSTTTGREDERWEFLSLGLGEPVPGQRAARPAHRRPARRGRRPLPDASAAHAAEVELDGDDDVAGRPASPRRLASPSSGAQRRQVTLFNRLIGEDRSVVHDMPGTTRDAIDTVVETDDGPIVFVDTAGMRRKAGSTTAPSTTRSSGRCRPIDDADIALLVIDATEGVTNQDQRLAERVDAAGCPIVVLLNKWELLDDAERRLDVAGRASSRKLHFIGDAPVLKISALTGKGVHKLRPVLPEAIDAVPPPGADPRGQPGASPTAQQRQPGAAAAPRCSTPCRAPPIRRRSRCSSTGSCRRPTCATSSAASARRSTSGRRRSSCASASAPSRPTDALVRGLRQVLDAVGDERRRHVPDVRPDAGDAHGRADHRQEPEPAGSSPPARTATRRTPRRRGTSSCCIVLLALYLTWRIVQLFT